jgi:hypothetical protein
MVILAEDAQLEATQSCKQLYQRLYLNKECN